MEKRIAIPKAVRDRVFRKYLGRCSYCGSDLSIFDAVIEHATPLSRGGTNEFYNLIPSCSYCNARKLTKTHYEFWSFLNSKIDEHWIKRAACNYPIYLYREYDNQIVLRFYWEYAFDQDLYDCEVFEEALNGAR